jgi:hypothetical protein
MNKIPLGISIAAIVLNALNILVSANDHDFALVCISLFFLLVSFISTHGLLNED